MGNVYLIPSLLHEDGMNALPAYILTAVKDCGIFFVENERTTRRFLKQLSRDIVIDDYEWFNMSDPGKVAGIFREKLRSGKNIGLISEAGCPGVADPGQELVKIAQELNAVIRPLVGPNAVLLALMASGLNGQQFRFCGYLPIDNHERIKAIRDLESESARLKCTQIFIETPYRNNQMIESILKTAHPATRLCIAVDLTGKSEWVKTAAVSEWQKSKPDIHKRPAIFLLLAG